MPVSIDLNNSVDTLDLYNMNKTTNNKNPERRCLNRFKDVLRFSTPED